MKRSLHEREDSNKRPIERLGDGAEQEDGTNAAAMEARAVDSPLENGESDEAYDNEDQDSSDSVAASDAAVVGRPDSSRSEASREKPRKRSRASSSSAMDVEDTVEETVNLTYPQPKNFPEKLMCVLQSGAAFSSIWWAGDGKAVALHSKNLQKGSVLETHFQMSDYASFVKNFPKWGFRRVTHYTVPDGVATFECSFFQKARPHLVAHMRMEDEQEGPGNNDKAGIGGGRVIPESIEFAGNNRQQGKLNRRNGADPGLQPHQQQLIDWLNGQSWAQTAPPNTFSTAPFQQASLAQPPMQQQLPPQMQPPPQQPPSPQQISSSPQQISSSPQQPSPPVPPQQLSQPQEGNLASSLASLLLQGGRPNQQTSTESNILYAQIFQLSQQYLSQPASASNISIRTVLQLLQAFELQNQTQRTPLLQQLNHLLGASGATTQQQPPPLSQFSQPPSFPSHGAPPFGNAGALEALLLSSLAPSNHQGLQLNNTHSTTNAALAQLQELLLGQQRGASGQSQQGSAPLLSHQSGASSAVPQQPTLDVSALLRQMLQQRQGPDNNQDIEERQNA